MRMWPSKTRIKYLIFGIVAVILIDMFGLLSHLFEIDYYSKFSYPLNIHIEEVLVALKNGKKPPISPINEYNFRFKIKNENKCKQDGNIHKYDDVVILYVIKSALNHQNKRDGIRKTWGWEHRFSDVVIRRVFLLGTSNDSSIQDEIDEEYAKHKDIVQADFLDSYYNNTIKTMMGFKWVVQKCSKAQFIMFADDDMYVSTKNLLKFLRNPFNQKIGFRKLLNANDEMINKNKNLSCHNCDVPSENSKKSVEFKDTSHIVSINANNVMSKHHTNSSNLLEINSNREEYLFRKLHETEIALSAFDGRLLAGYVFFSSPMRHKPSKWYVTLEEYPYSKYPPYVTAGAYVMSYPALVDLYYTSLYTRLFRFDDVYLGIVAKKCGITPMHNENFYFWKKAYDKHSYADVIASHGFGDPEELRKVWEEQRSSGHA